MVKMEATIEDIGNRIRFDKMERTDFKTRAAEIAAAKRWAARRGDESCRYLLTIWDCTHDGYGILLDSYVYSGKCVRAW